MSTGGSFILHSDGTRECVQPPTAHHPDGDAPRTADGQVIGTDGLPMPEPVEPTEPPAEPEPEPDQAPPDTAEES